MLNLPERLAGSFQHQNNSEIPGQARNDNPHVVIKVFDILGREVATLVNEKQRPGNYQVEFKSHSGTGRILTSGIYFYRITAGKYIETKKMILLK